MQSEFISKYWFSENNTEYFIHCGKTGSGKTYNAINKLKSSKSGTYLAPLRLLAWEIYEKLNSEGFRCSLLTGEEKVQNIGANFTSSTIEMYNPNKHQEVVVIDEAFMIGDEDRGKSWLSAIIKANANEVHIITSLEGLPLIEEILTITNRKYHVKKYEMLQEFVFTESRFKLTTKIPNKGIFVTFSRIDCLVNKVKLEAAGKSVSILYGNLPPEVKKRQIEDFISGKNDVMVATDVIGMGINVPCDYIVFLKHEKFDGKNYRPLNPSEIRQISGRTGRYGLSAKKSFVSATEFDSLQHIKTMYNKPTPVKNAYFGLDFEIYAHLPKSATIKERIQFFLNSELIPLELKKIIKKESVLKYFQVEPYIANLNFDIDTEWAFLTAPIKENNKEYFLYTINSFKESKKLLSPELEIVTLYDSKWIEDKISEIELYLNLSRNLPYEESEKFATIKQKDVLIQHLDRILLDKKLSSKKKCKLCPSMISIMYPHHYCNTCYKSKISSQYY